MARAAAATTSTMWTPSLFHKIFLAVARSDVGVLGAMDNRSQTIAMNEYLRFMKVNNYQKLGLTLTDLTDAFKFANQSTDDKDKNEMTETEFGQCLLFTQARYLARHAPEGAPLVSTTRPPFDVSSNIASQLGPFLVQLCGSKLIVQGGSTGLQVTEVFLRTPIPSRPSSAGSCADEAEDAVPARHLPDDDEEELSKPITQREMNAFFGEMRLIFTRLQKRAKANRYLERVIAGSKGGLSVMPSKSEQDERSRLTIEYRTTIHDMNALNELVRTIDTDILAADKQLKRLLEERIEGVAVVDAGKEGAKKMWISAEEEHRLKMFERKLNESVNEVEKKVGLGIASNARERHIIQEHRNQIMAVKSEIATLGQVGLGVDFMTNQHGLLTGHVLDEQRAHKNKQFELIKKLKEMQLDTAMECKKLEEQCEQMDARMQAVENEILEKPPDRAAMNKLAGMKAAAKQELKETRAAADALESKMKKMLSGMGIQPAYAMKEIEGCKPVYYVSDNGSIVDAFQSFEDKAFKGESEMTARKMKIFQLETEISVLNDEYESSIRHVAMGREKEKELIEEKRKQLEAAQASAAAEHARFVETECLLVEIERTLANINDKLARGQPSSDSKKLLPVREVFVPPVSEVAHIRTRKLLEMRLMKLLGSKTTLLACDLLCTAGSVDLLCTDRRDRLILVCFANPLTGYAIDTALVSHCSEIQSAFYLLRRLPASSLNALSNCFLETGVASFREILNSRVHRFVIIGKSIADDCDTASFSSGVELVKADDIKEVWHGEATKRALFGGVPSPEELSALICADAACAAAAALPVSASHVSQSLHQSRKAWDMVRAAQQQGAWGRGGDKVTYRQFVDWIRRTAAPEKFFLPPDTGVDEVVKRFIIADMKWNTETAEAQEKHLQGAMGPHAVYRCVAQLGERIKLFAACGVTFAELSPSPPPLEADSGLEVIVEAWKAAASAAANNHDAAADSAVETADHEPGGPAKHEVAGGTWMVEAIARIVLRYMGCMPPIKAEEQAGDLQALKNVLKNSQAENEKDKIVRDLTYQRKSSKKFAALSHAAEFQLYGHQMIESQKNLKQCEDLLETFLEHNAAAISSRSSLMATCELDSASENEGEEATRRRGRNKMVVRPPSLSSSDEDEATAQHRKSFEELFIAASKNAVDEEVPDPISSTALRRQFKAAPVTQVSDNVVRVDPAAKVAKTQQHFHSRVYVGTVHASLKFLPNRNWYPELHSDIRRSLQKFETLTKALSKIKGAPKVVNLADEEIAEAKSRKLPKIQTATAPNSVWETAKDNSCPESPGIISHLALLDHLLQLPSEQLRKTSHRNTTVSHTDLNQPVVQLAGQAAAAAGVSLFSSAAAAASLSAPGHHAASGSPPRHVQFAAVDAGFERVRAVPPREEARVADLKSLPSKVSPRTRAIKAAASAAGGAAFSIAAAVSKSSGGFAGQGKRDDDEQKFRGGARSTKAVYGSVRFGTKEKVAQKPCAIVEGAQKPCAIVEGAAAGRA